VSIRELLTSRLTAERELAGIVVNELIALDKARENLKPHPKEDRLNGKGLDEISYIRMYSNGYSVRVYFTIIHGGIWMLALDRNKRQTNLTDGTKSMLLNRLHEARELASESAIDDAQMQGKRAGRGEGHSRGK